MKNQWMGICSIGGTVLFLLSGCAKLAGTSDNVSGLSSDKPAGVVSAVQDAMLTAGASMAGPVAGNAAARVAKISKAQGNGLTSAVCNQYGSPLSLSYSDGNYPGYLTYCFMTVDSGDTVLGGFDLPSIITCAIEKVGVTYDGVTRDVVIDGNSGCFGVGQGVPASMNAKITASSPAAFNPHFEKGVIIDLSADMSLTFKIAVNVKNNVASFITMEDWSNDGHIGATSGSLDFASGDLRYESRLERIDCPTASSCGWNRHTRVHATLKMQAEKPIGLKDISFAYSNIQAPPGQNGYGGVLITAAGDLVNGIKARLWGASHGDGSAPTSKVDYDVVSNWVEGINAACYTADSDAAGSCGAGGEIFVNHTDFLLNGGQTSVPNWFGLVAPATFTAVDLDQDVQ